jgi:hypothetical protein
MKGITDHRQRQARRWVIWGIFLGSLLAGAAIAIADNQFSTRFEQVENGMNHCNTPSDSHHICGIGMNSLLGHYTVTIALVSQSKGIIEYHFNKADIIYGTVDLIGTSVPGVSRMSIQLTKGMGRFKNISGRATGTMVCSSAQLGVQPYTARIAGTIDTPTKEHQRSWQD